MANIFSIMKSKYFLYSLLIVSLLSCNKSKTTQEIKKKESSVFVRTWFDTVRIVPFSEKLEIRQNQTFKFVGGACTSRWWSEGEWILKNDTIVLNSFKSKKCNYLRDYGAMCRTIEQIKINGRELSIKDCKPDSDDDYVMFINEKFYILNDTLVHVKQNKKCEGIDIVYSIREKKR